MVKKRFVINTFKYDTYSVFRISPDPVTRLWTVDATSTHTNAKMLCKKTPIVRY